MRVVMLVPMKFYRDALLDRFATVPDLEVVVAENPEELDAKIERSDIFIFGGRAYTDEVEEIVRTKGKSIRWFHTTSAGNEPIITRGAPKGVTVTRSGGHSAPVVAEHAIALLLALARGLPYAFQNQAKRQWVRVLGGPRAGTMRSLYGRTAVVLGFGPIGQEIARRLKVLGMKVLAVTRSGSPHQLADESYNSAHFKKALSKASVLVVAAPGSPETRGMVGAEELAAMQPDGFVVNVGRGHVVNTAALEAALHNGTILGAALDVLDPEPLPPEHSLWDAPNLIITPHRGGGGDPQSPYRQADAVLANLEKFRRGEPLDHVLETHVRTDMSSVPATPST